MMNVPLIILAAALAAGCGAANTGQSATAPTSAAPQAAAAPREDPKLGATMAIKSFNADIKATAYTYRQPLRSVVPPQRKGYTYAGVDVRLCMPRIPEGVTEVSAAPWSLEYADDTVAEPISSWSDEWFTVRLYPIIPRKVREGGCVRGWIVFEVPKGKRPVRVVYSPDSEAGTAPVVWTIR